MPLRWRFGLPGHRRLVGRLSHRPRACPVTVLGRRGSRTLTVPAGRARYKESYPPTVALQDDLWISPPAILGSDDARGPAGRYDRGPVAATLTDGAPRFAHQSEAELARILDFYGVAWRYEPDIFPISWNAAGAVVESFAPDFRWTLVDSVGRKTVVLRGFAEALGLRNVTVLADRAEALGRDIRYREHSAIVTARACAALPILAELALPLLRIGGRLLAWKGPLTDDDEEVRRGGEAIRLLGGGRLQVFETGLPALGGHRFVIVRKEQPTPALFPHRPVEPGRRPLG